MKYKLLFSLIALGSVLLMGYQNASASFTKPQKIKHQDSSQGVIEGKVINTIADDEGLKIILDSNGQIRTVYLPRVTENRAQREEAMQARGTGKAIKIKQSAQAPTL